MPRIDDPVWSDRLAYDFDVSDTSPVVRGTWVTVAHVVNLLVDGDTWSDVLRTHPELTEGNIRACVAYAVADDDWGKASAPCAGVPNSISTLMISPMPSGTPVQFTEPYIAPASGHQFAANQRATVATCRDDPRWGFRYSIRYHGEYVTGVKYEATIRDIPAGYLERAPQ